MILAQAEPGSLEMPHVDWGGLSPVVVLAGGALVILTATALGLRRPPRTTWSLLTAGIGLGALAAAVLQWNRVDDDGAFAIVADALVVDGFSVFLTALIAASVVLAALLADGYLRRERLDGPELYVLMLLSATGGVMMAMANDLIVLFLGLEVLSIALYVLAGYHLRRTESSEAGLKYFVLGAFSSAFLLYGVALVYGATGSTNLGDIGEFLETNVLTEDGLLLAGFALLLVGLGFKVSAVPFHVWTPDVYQGAPTPVTAFMASASKVAGFAGLLRVFVSTFDLYEDDWRPVVFVLAALTLLVGSVLAIVQNDVKRMMAYSSVSHAGFVLVGVQAASERGVSGALFYLFAYTFMVVGTFGVITLVGRRGDADHGLEAYRGLATRQPVLALVFVVFLLAQAGVPFTSGFLAKFYVIGAAVDADSYALAIVAMLAAAVSAYLYLRVVVAMYMSADGEEGAPGPAERVRVPALARISLGVALVVTVLFGLLPGPAIDWADDATAEQVAEGE